jgi:hypothetical protein
MLWSSHRADRAMTASASVRTDTVVTLTAPAIPVVNLPRIAADVAGLREYGRWFVSTWRGPTP